MANETILSLVSQFIPDIIESAKMYAFYNTFMPTIVEFFGDQSGWQAREVTQYKESGVDDNLGELEDLTPTDLDRELLARLSPKEIGKQHLISKRRLTTDPENVVADAAIKVGYEMGKKVELDLMGDFANLTGGSVGTANNALTWADIYAGRSRLAAAAVPGPYSVVLHEWQWHDLATAANIAGSSLQPVLTIRNDIQSQYYLGSVNGMNFYVSGLVPIDGNADATGAIFSRSALAFDLRQGLDIGPEYDESLRAAELNWTMVYAHGIWQPTYGVKIISDATALGSDVTTNSDILLIGAVDDATASSGQDIIFTVTMVNIGTVVSTGIEVTITTPSGVTYVADSVSQGSYNSSTKVWTAGSLAPGKVAVGRFTYDVTVTGDFSGDVTAVVPSEVSAGDTGNITVTVS